MKIILKMEYGNIEMMEIKIKIPFLMMQLFYYYLKILNPNKEVAIYV